MGAPIFDRKECLEYLLLLSKSKDPQSAKAAGMTDIQLSLDRDGPLGVKSVAYQANTNNNGLLIFNIWLIFTGFLQWVCFSNIATTKIR